MVKRILAIETSCDETAISIFEIHGTPPGGEFKILSSIVSSQVKIHAKWGGVVPNLAKREHLKNLPLVLKRALKEAKTKEPNKEIDLIAVTNGPGLEPALWTGINFSENLAKKWKKPLIPINHMEGHLFSVFLKQKEFSIPNLQFPIIALLVSGGHTELILVKNWLKYKMLGQTRDDAAGEAFDKVAKMLGLGYPGGPAIAKLTSNYRGRTSLVKYGGSTSLIELPRPMINSNDYDFSFSGLKTSVLYKLKEFTKIDEKIKAVFCKEFQQAVIDVLITKTFRATEQYKAKTIILGGGVSANKELRLQFQTQIQRTAYNSSSKYMLNIKLLMPEIKFAGDNAAMIALAAYFRTQNTQKKKELASLRALKADGNLKIA